MTISSPPNHDRHEIFKYLFAKKRDREFCVKFNLDWEENAVDYLLDKEYELTPASVQHWNRMINIDGSSIACYLLDKDLENFDIGTF